MKFSVIVLILVLLLGCSEKDDVNIIASEQTVDRSLFVSKDIQYQKDYYKTLTFVQKRNLWVSKLNQVIKSGIDDEQVGKFKFIIQVLKNSNDEDELFEDDKLEEAVIQIANNLSEAGFVNIFSKLGDYKYRNEDFKSSNKQLLSKVKSSFESTKLMRASALRTTNESPGDNESPGERNECNCDWTCGGEFSECTHSNCEPTTTGCGIFWLQSCEERDELLESDCP